MGFGTEALQCYMQTVADRPVAGQGGQGDIKTHGGHSFERSLLQEQAWLPTFVCVSVSAGAVQSFHVFVLIAVTSRLSDGPSATRRSCPTYSKRFSAKVVTAVGQGDTPGHLRWPGDLA